MSKWILIISLAMPDGAAQWTIEGFLSAADCQRAAIQAKTSEIRGSYGQPVKTACIERPERKGKNRP